LWQFWSQWQSLTWQQQSRCADPLNPPGAEVCAVVPENIRVAMLAGYRGTMLAVDHLPVERVPLGPEADFPIGHLKTTYWADQHTVAELLPAGFDRYLRIFHPFLRSTTLDDGVIRETRTWRSLAEEAGVVFHPEIVRESLLPALPVLDDEEAGRAWNVEEGRLEDPAWTALFETLTTRSPKRDAYFLFGWTLAHPVLFRADIGNFGAVQAVADEHLRTGGGDFPADSPEFVWPVDRSWVVNTDPDLVATFVACDEALADMILAHPALEVLPVTLASRVDRGADRINLRRAAEAAARRKSHRRRAT
jgi:hypothetical protein